MRTILLTGKSGQIGWELQRALAHLGKVIAFDSKELDLTGVSAVRQRVREIKPALIVNTAAYTAVDKAESEAELAMSVNGTAPGVLAEEAGRLGAWLVHYSTDYVFDGGKGEGYCETDQPNPLNVYGHTKLVGEEAVRASGCKHFILRTSWVYGAHGQNFMRTMLRLGKEREELKIVDDQVGVPTWSRSVAEVTGQILAQLYSPFAVEADIEAAAGTYHVAASGSVSWCGFAQEIFRQADPDIERKVVAISSAEFGALAERPKNSVLSSRKLGEVFGLSLGGWEESLGLCLADMRV